MKSLTAKVAPDVLRWARESAGVTVEEVGTRLHVSVQTVAAWESGDKEPTVAALEKLATTFRRPLAAFFLPRPPQEPALPADFRTLPGGTPLPLSKKTRFAIRKAQRLQRVTRSLISELDLRCQVSVGTATGHSDPETVAASERRKLGVDTRAQSRWRSAYEALQAWRNAIERLGLLTFQFSMPLEDGRGFSLVEDNPPTIVVNAADAINARIFTLFHEYGHALLGRGGLCFADETTEGEHTGIERFCNRFAGALLVEGHALRSHVRIGDVVGLDRIDDTALVGVARYFKVSREVIWRRMRSLRLISASAFKARLSRWQSEPKPRRKKQKGGLSAAKRSVQERGHRLTSLVLEARERDLLNYGDASELLSVPPGDLRKVGAIVSGLTGR